MSEEKHTEPQKNDKSQETDWGHSVGVTLIAVGIVGLGVWFLGLGHLFPSQWVAKSMLEAWAINDHMDRVSEARQAPDVTTATSMVKSADVILSSDRYQIEHGVHSCPENSHWLDGDKTHKVMDLTGCMPGRSMFWIAIPDSAVPVSYFVAIYKYGRGEPKSELEKKVGKQLIKSAEDVAIKKCGDNDTFAVANRVSPKDSVWNVLYDLRGKTCYFPNGTADFMEVLKK